MRPFRSPILFSLALLALAAAYAFAHGFRWIPRYNFTPSMPEGWYLPISGTPFKRGEVVVACPPSWIFHLARKRGYLPSLKGSCANGSVPFVKFLAALPGDRISIERHYVVVNGCVLRHSGIAVRDPSGRALPHLLHAGIVPWVKVLLIGEARKSFDGRYFGLVPMSDIKPAPLLRLFGKQPTLRCLRHLPNHLPPQGAPHAR